MSTARNAATALRTIHEDEQFKPRDAAYLRFITLTTLDEAFRKYAAALPKALDDAYNVACRQERWYPAPWSNCLLRGPDAAGLRLFSSRELQRSLRPWRGFRELKEAAVEAGVLLKVMIMPDSASIVVEFRHQGPGRACIIA